MKFLSLESNLFRTSERIFTSVVLIRTAGTSLFCKRRWLNPRCESERSLLSHGFENLRSRFPEHLQCRETDFVQVITEAKVLKVMIHLFNSICVKTSHEQDGWELQCRGRPALSKQDNSEPFPPHTPFDHSAQTTSSFCHHAEESGLTAVSYHRSDHSTQHTTMTQRGTSVDEYPGLGSGSAYQDPQILRITSWPPLAPADPPSVAPRLNAGDIIDCALFRADSEPRVSNLFGGNVSAACRAPCSYRPAGMDETDKPESHGWMEMRTAGRPAGLDCDSTLLQAASAVGPAELGRFQLSADLSDAKPSAFVRRTGWPGASGQYPEVGTLAGHHDGGMFGGDYDALQTWQRPRTSQWQNPAAAFGLDPPARAAENPDRDGRSHMERQFATEFSIGLVPRPQWPDGSGGID